MHKQPVSYVCCICPACVATGETRRQVHQRLAFAISQTASTYQKPVELTTDKTVQTAYKSWKAELLEDCAKGQSIDTYLDVIEFYGEPYYLSC